jgi:Mini-chromosome maintenance replisome factor
MLKQEPPRQPAGTTVESLSETLSNTHLGCLGSMARTEGAFAAPGRDSCIVLLYDQPASDVRLHDVINVIGVLDSALHEDVGGIEDLQDDFDEIMEDQMDEENLGDNENSGMPTARRRQVQPPRMSNARGAVCVRAATAGASELTLVPVQSGAPQLRVHAMHVQRYSNLGCSPYDFVFIKRSLARDFAASMRHAAVQWLARPFGGNKALGELLLLQLVCRNARVSTGCVMRRMTLNICGLPQACSDRDVVDSSRLTLEAAEQPYGRAAASLVSPGAGLAAGTTSTIAASVAEAVSALFPFVQVLPATDQVMLPSSWDTCLPCASRIIAVAQTRAALQANWLCSAAAPAYECECMTAS